MKTSFLKVTAILVISILKLSFCQNNTNEAKRSTIVGVDGYAYLSEDRTIRELREEALSNAKREALERAQTYIKSFTKVENFTLTYDLVQSGAEGYIKILESKDYGITKDNRYHYWIKAEVEYMIKNHKIDPITSGKAPLTISVWTEKTEYKTDEDIRIFLKGNKDFYATIVYENASGKLLQLLPNQHRKNNFFKKGKVFMIPDKSDRFRLEVEPPFGKEHIIVYASNVPIGNAPIDVYGNYFYRISGGLKNFSTKTRGVNIVKCEEGNQCAEFYEARCELITRTSK